LVELNTQPATTIKHPNVECNTKVVSSKPINNNWSASSSLTTSTGDSVKHADTLINEYYSPAITVRHVSNSNNKTNNPYQYTNTLASVPSNSNSNSNNNNNNNLINHSVSSSNHRSSSEPRFNPAPALSNNPYTMYQQNAYANSSNSNMYNSNGFNQTPTYHTNNKANNPPIVINDFQDFSQNQFKYIMANNNVASPSTNDLQATRLSTETYDNLSDHHNQQIKMNSARLVSTSSACNDHQSRVDAKYNQLTNIYEKYSSMRSNTFKTTQNASLINKERDIKSVDREINTPVSFATTSTNSRLARRNSSITDDSSPIHKSDAVINRNVSSNIMMGLGAKQHRNLEAQLRDLKSCDRDFMQKTNRSGSITPHHDECDNLTEEDEDENSGSLSYNKRYSVKKDELITADMLIDETSLINTLDDSAGDDCDNSKIKMKLMQNQLQKLTNLVHKALANRDLNQLAAQCDLQNMFDLDFSPKMSHSQPKRAYGSTSSRGNKRQLAELNNKTKMLRNDLSTIKKLHESFNLSFGDSLKSFANQLNVSFLNHKTTILKMSLIIKKKYLNMFLYLFA